MAPVWRPVPVSAVTRASSLKAAVPRGGMSKESVWPTGTTRTWTGTSWGLSTRMVRLPARAAFPDAEFT